MTEYVANTQTESIVTVSMRQGKPMKGWKTMKTSKMNGFSDSLPTVPVKRFTRDTLESLTQRDFDILMSKAVHSTRKAIEGQGIKVIPADVEIAVSETIASFWERSSWLDYKRIQFFQKTRIALPLQAFINKKTRQNYYDMMKRPGESRKTLASTELRGYEKVDKALTDVEFYEALERVEPAPYRVLCKMLLQGYTRKEVAKRLECSEVNIHRMLKIMGQIITEWNNW